jgi:hypothetical protein
VLDAASQAGLVTSVDIVSTENPAFRAIAEAALPHTDHLVINEVEAGKIAGIHLKTVPVDVEAVREVALALLARGVRERVVIHFEAGAVAADRTGIVTASGFNRVSLYGARGAFVEQVTLFGGGRQFLAYGARDVLGSAPIEGSLEVNTSARVRGGWNVSTRGERGFVRFDPRSYAAYALGAPASSAQPFERAEGVFGAMLGSATVTTPTWRLWQGSVRVEQGTRAIFPEATEGRARGVTGSLSLRPTPAVRVFGTLTMQTLERRDGSEFARTILPRLKAEVQPNRWVFFRLVAEYRNERQSALRDARRGLPIFVNGAAVSARENNRLRMDWLASYEPSPGTVAFFGYGSTLRADRAMAFEGLERVNDGFFVKFAYLFRR